MNTHDLYQYWEGNFMFISYNQYFEDNTYERNYLCQYKKEYISFDICEIIDYTILSEHGIEISLRHIDGIEFEIFFNFQENTIEIVVGCSYLEAQGIYQDAVYFKNLQTSLFSSLGRC